MTAALLITLASVPSPAFANSVTEVEVTGVGVQGSEIYITTKKALPGCNGPIVYQAVDATGQYVMSIALTARSTAKPLARLDYFINGQGICWV